MWDFAEVNSLITAQRGGARIYIRIRSWISLYCFRSFFLPIFCLNSPKYFARRGNIYCSPTQAMKKYPIPRTRIKTRKSHVMYVSSMNRYSQSAGSKSIYDENSKVTTIVTTNGTTSWVSRSTLTKGREQNYNFVSWSVGKVDQCSEQYLKGCIHNRRWGITLCSRNYWCLAFPSQDVAEWTYNLVSGGFLLQKTHELIYQGCLLTAWKPTAWIIMTIAIWPSSGVKTFRETKFAVGRFLHSTGYAPVQPTEVEC